jgi:hypothetical protein
LHCQGHGQWNLPEEKKKLSSLQIEPRSLCPENELLPTGLAVQVTCNCTMIATTTVTSLLTTSGAGGGRRRVRRGSRARPPRGCMPLQAAAAASYGPGRGGRGARARAQGRGGGSTRVVTPAFQRSGSRRRRRRRRRRRLRRRADSRHCCPRPPPPPPPPDGPLRVGSTSPGPLDGSESGASVPGPGPPDGSESGASVPGRPTRAGLRAVHPASDSSQTSGHQVHASRTA